MWHGAECNSVPRRFELLGLSEAIGSEEQCEEAVRRWRWPDGFRCPKCGGREHGVVGRQKLYECHACERQTSLKAGTIFAQRRMRLTTWFRAIWFITQSKGSISTL
jgi:transposase-like protein